MTPTVASVAVQQLTITTLPRVDVSEFSDFVFLLGDEWALNGDDIRLYWVLNLFAAGLAENGKEVCLCVCEHCIVLSTNNGSLPICCRFFLALKTRPDVPKSF